ncbi:hypothetical protein CPB85DRAFT_1453612 [Mucidula mucida]|nr:hypothetical protein CPB85DRAFT_1453612 [Mucidula mucida]
MALGGKIALDNTLGALEIAVLLAALLFGALCVQAWTYINDYQRDAWYIKAMVALVFFGNLLHQGFLCHSLYIDTVTYYGDIIWITSIPWSFLAVVGTSGCIAFIVQLFYIHRIFKLSKGMYSLPIFLAVVSLAEFAVNMYAVYEAKTITVYTDQYKLKPYLLAYNALGAFLDCLIAGSMIFFLMQNRTKFKSTNSMLTRLMVYCVTTGIFTSMAAILTIITLAIWDKTMIDHPFYCALPRHRDFTVYGASLFGILNARNDIRNGASSPTAPYSANEISLSLIVENQLRSYRPDPDVDRSESKPSAMVVNVHQEVHRQDDQHSTDMFPSED